MSTIESRFANWEYQDYVPVFYNDFVVVFPVENCTSENIVKINIDTNTLANELKQKYPHANFKIILCIKNIHHYLYFDEGIGDELRIFYDPDGGFSRRFLGSVDTVITTTSTGLYQEQDLGFLKVIKI